MKFKSVAALLGSCLLAAATWAHELPANRMSLVLRDDTHVALTAYIDYSQALHQTLAPQQTRRDFLAQYGAMETESFRAAVADAQAQWRSETLLTLPSGEALAIQNWRWPDAERMQAILKTFAMHLLTGGDEHDQFRVDEIHAEAISGQKIESVSAQLPQPWGRVLVVSYRPRQVWKEPGAAPVAVGF